ncbi:Thiol-specific monooxygenase [Paramyrothecium foliicola]|nr:Thiol-specific monooxygenase [Paramyrothecium foliicola]
MGSLPIKHFDVRKIAIIGAGPGGLCAAKYLKAQNTFNTIVVFEQENDVGGIWKFSDHAPEGCPVPQEDPFYPTDRPLPGPKTGAPVFPSPLYNKLHANIPGSLMRFSDLKFPSDAWVFPQRETIHKYLIQYAEDVRGLIKFRFQVKKITRQEEDGRDKWRVEAQSTVDDEHVNEAFDAVVIANGHYAVPFIPSMKNIEQFHAAHPSVITHSKQYRVPDTFKDKKVLVIGNGPSGIDIAAQINTVTPTPTLLSVRQATEPERLTHTGCEEVPEIEEFLADVQGVRFKDGRVESGIDAIVFCTGFLFSYPFLPDLRAELITTGRGVHGLYKHLFNIQHPTLVFPGLNMKAVPWPEMESQAALFSAVWSNNLNLPSVDEMREWNRQLEESAGDALHVFPSLADGHYINELHDWVMRAPHVGKEPPYWDDEMFWQRKIFAEAKLRFEQGGCKATSLEELGFRYEAPT